MAIAVGTNLGTTNSVIAATDAGKPTVIANAGESRTTPSVVAFTDLWGARSLLADRVGRLCRSNTRLDS